MGFRGGKLAMADIAVGELALLRSYMFFGSVDAMHTLRRCVTRQIAPDLAHTSALPKN